MDRKGQRGGNLRLTPEPLRWPYPLSYLSPSSCLLLAAHLWVNDPALCLLTAQTSAKGHK